MSHAARDPWVPVFLPAGGFMGEPCPGLPPGAVYLGTVTCCDSGRLDVDLHHYVSVDPEAPGTYHLHERTEGGAGVRFLGSMAGGAPDLATAALALWEAMLVGRDPRFLAAKAIVPGPLLSAAQTGAMLERVDTCHLRLFFPERFPDLREEMLAAARTLLARTETVVLEPLPPGEPSPEPPAALPRVGHLWETPKLKVTYYLRQEAARAVLVEDRSPMQLRSSNTGWTTPTGHAVRDVASCPAAGAGEPLLGALLLLKYRPDPRLQSLEGVPALAGKGLRLLLGAPQG